MFEIVLLSSRFSYLSLSNTFSRKRRYNDELDDREHLFGGRSNVDDDDIATIVSHAAIELVNSNRPTKHPRLPNIDRNDSKMF